MNLPHSPQEAPQRGLPPLGKNGSLLLRDVEQLACYMSSECADEKRVALAGMSWGDAAEMLPALRRLVLSSHQNRQLIKRTVDALLPLSSGPLSTQDPEVLKGKLWLQARLFAIHEKAPLQL